MESAKTKIPMETETPVEAKAQQPVEIYFLSSENVLYFICTSIIVYIAVHFFYKINQSKMNECRFEEVPDLPNLAFYCNQICSKPNGDYIENILSFWYGDYHILGKEQSYIQWLFPTEMSGLSPDAYSLREEEAKAIREKPILKHKVMEAFAMMLYFYGMRLTIYNQFELTGEYRERLEELNKWGNHNFLHISRILLALKELGHKHLMLPWMKFLADLIYKKGYLDQARPSFEIHWIKTLDVADKIELQQYLRNYRTY